MYSYAIMYSLLILKPRVCIKTLSSRHLVFQLRGNNILGGKNNVIRLVEKAEIS